VVRISRKSGTRRETPWYRKYTKKNVHSNLTKIFHSNLSVTPYSVNTALNGVTISVVSNGRGSGSGALPQPRDNILAAETVHQDWK
jgi:hypothetical protein